MCLRPRPRTPVPTAREPFPITGGMTVAERAAWWRRHAYVPPGHQMIVKRRGKPPEGLE